MGLISVVAAAIAAFVFGAVWYTALGSRWATVSGVALDADGQPANRSNPVPYIMAFVSVLLVAGMMRHSFVLGGIDTVAKGLVSGLGIGLFMVTPWIATCYGFAGRARALTLIDGGYATLGCAVIGTVLTLL